MLKLLKHLICSLLLLNRYHFSLELRVHLTRPHCDYNHIFPRFLGFFLLPDLLLTLFLPLMIQNFYDKLPN